MKIPFNVSVTKFSTLRELPEAWTAQNYKDLLEALDYGDTSEIATSELKEMCMMAISDNEPDEAARIVLEYVFKERLNDGQKDNLSHEMIDEKMWEEYADLSMHEDFFNVGHLLYSSFNGKFPNPEAVKFEITVSGKNQNDLAIFETETEATLLRLIAQGMPHNTLINRLFKEQLEGESFPEAEHIIWQLKQKGKEGNAMTFEVISSAYWFHDLKYVESFDGVTFPDEVVLED